jgi:putative flippase GtrA
VAMGPMVRRIIRFEPARYTAVGAVMAAFNNLVFIFGDWAGLGYIGLMGLSWGLSGSVGYLLHSRYTFGASHNWSAYGRFMGGIAMGIPLTLALLAALKSGLHLPMWIAAPVTTVGMFFYNYLSARLAIVWHWISARPV